MEPLISVIVPVYKVEQYLGRCVKSLLTQTYKNTEIICSNTKNPSTKQIDFTIIFDVTLGFESIKKHTHKAT